MRSSAGDCESVGLGPHCFPGIIASDRVGFEPHCTPVNGGGVRSGAGEYESAGLGPHCFPARAFISAAATEKLAQCKLGLYEDKGPTVKGAWDMGLTPLRMSEAPILKILPAGALKKYKWRNTIGGSGGVKGEHYRGSSYHAAPGEDPVRYWFAGEASVCVTGRCGQADVPSAYNAPKVGVDAHGSPPRALGVRKTSWYDAVQVVSSDQGGRRQARSHD
jgi:hypothetical protein